MFWVRDGDHNRLPDQEIALPGDGYRYLRAQDLCDGEIKSESPVFVRERYFMTVNRSHIRPGYLLFSIMASIGNMAIVPEDFKICTANRAVGILVPKQDDHLLTCYVFYLFSTEFGSKLYNRIRRGGLQQRTNLADVERLEIPLPPLGTIEQLTKAMDSARARRREKLDQADELLASLDQYLLDTLGLALPQKDARKVFCVTVGQMRGKRLDPPAFRPLYEKANQPKTPLADIVKLAAIDPHVSFKPNNDDELVPYVGLPQCTQTEVRDVIMRPFSEVKGRRIVKPGDILFARIEPSIFNQKYVLVDDLKSHEYAFTSTEFYVVTPRKGEAETEYLYAMFFCSFVFAQVQGKTTGSSGRRRLGPELFRTIQIPKPSIGLQKEIAAEVIRRREEARRLRAEAEEEWAAAKRWFEEQLLGPVAA